MRHKIIISRGVKDERVMAYLRNELMTTAFRLLQEIIHVDTKNTCEITSEDLLVAIIRTGATQFDNILQDS